MLLARTSYTVNGIEFDHVNSGLTEVLGLGSVAFAVAAGEL